MKIKKEFDWIEFANHISSMSNQQNSNKKPTNGTTGFKKQTTTNNNGFQKQTNGNKFQKPQGGDFKKTVKNSKTLYIGKITNNDLER
jgi:hypothetical protein